jgi:hypothetical protein
VIYGIEGKSVDPDTGLSPEVEHAAGEVVERVLREIEDGTSCMNRR